MDNRNYGNFDMNNKNFSADKMNYENYEIDREAFGAFVAAQRKEKGYTQKELADRLFVSDKAVSKWERGLSLPDISILVPLSEALGVTVMELLQGRRIEAERKEDFKLGFTEVEQLVKRAVTFSEEETPEERKQRIEKDRHIFLKLLAISMSEVLVCVAILFSVFKAGRDMLYINCITSFGTLEILGITFGIYIWLFMKDRLPSYYDENKIGTYSDGMFHMNMPGLYFNNRNWKPITKVLKQWDAAVLVCVPFLCMLMLLFMPGWVVGLVFSMVVLFAFLLGLFVPMYVVGRKYGV